MLHDVNDEDEPWMRRALQLAATAAEVGEVPVGALIVRGGIEIAAGVNTTEREKDPCGHAEIGAIRAASRALGEKRLEGCTLYVTLEPCAMCAGAMVWARVQRCVFGAYDPKGGFCGTLGNLSAYPGLNHRYEVRGGVLADEASAQLKSFFAALRRR
jgi:tRNA(adenine34) deaminase